MKSDPQELVIIVWFDMDGTLVKFIDGGDIFRSRYFEELPPHEEICETASKIDGMELGTRIINGQMYRIVLKTASLSSYLTNTPHDVLTEKNNSLDAYTSIPRENRVFIPCGSSKWSKVVSMGLEERSILIDDFGRNLADWKGPCIKVSRNAKDMEKEMRRYTFCISPDNSVKENIETIKRCVSTLQF